MADVVSDDKSDAFKEAFNIIDADSNSFNDEFTALDALLSAMKGEISLEEFKKKAKKIGIDLGSINLNKLLGKKLGDKLSEFWKKNKKKVVAGVAVAGIGGFGWIFYAIFFL